MENQIMKYSCFDLFQTAQGRAQNPVVFVVDSTDLMEMGKIFSKQLLSMPNVTHIA
jgi:hypothetical protein